MTDRDTGTARPGVGSGRRTASNTARGLVRPAAVDLVWTNPLGGETFLTHSSDGSTRYLKIAPMSLPTSHHPVREAERVRWIGNALPVPHVIDAGYDVQVSWMLSDALPGLPASEFTGHRDPRLLAVALGRAVRSFHDALDPGTCPWSWDIETRRAIGRGSDEAAAMLPDAPPEVDLVVAHGDICAPNILLDDDLGLTGFTDLGKVGIAARAADLGCHRWSLEFNGMAELVPAFLEAYGFDGDPDEVRWYRDYFVVV